MKDSDIIKLLLLYKHLHFNEMVCQYFSCWQIILCFKSFFKIVHKFYYKCTFLCLLQKFWLYFSQKDNLCMITITMTQGDLFWYKIALICISLVNITTRNNPEQYKIEPFTSSIDKNRLHVNQMLTIQTNVMKG